MASSVPVQERGAGFFQVCALHCAVVLSFRDPHSNDGNKWRSPSALIVWESPCVLGDGYDLYSGSLLSNHWPGIVLDYCCEPCKWIHSRFQNPSHQQYESPRLSVSSKNNQTTKPRQTDRLCLCLCLVSLPPTHTNWDQIKMCAFKIIVYLIIWAQIFPQRSATTFLLRQSFFV